MYLFQHHIHFSIFHIFVIYIHIHIHIHIYEYYIFIYTRVDTHKIININTSISTHTSTHLYQHTKKISGDMYKVVPQNELCTFVLRDSALDTDQPKSANFSVFSSILNKIFSALKSRCVTPWECRWCRALCRCRFRCR